MNAPLTKQDHATTHNLPVHDPLMWFCLSLGFLQGIVINLLPVTFKVFQRLFSATYEMQGRTEALYFAGSIVGNILGGLAIARLRLRVSARAGLGLTGAGCLLMSIARGFVLVQVASVAMGLGASWLAVTYYTLISEHFQEIRQRMFSAAILSFSAGAIVAPFLMGNYIAFGWLERGWPWWLPFAILAVVFFARSVLIPRLKADRTAAGRSPGSWADVLRSPVLWTISALTVLHGLGQVGATAWMARLYEKRLALSEAHVGLMLSSNFLGVLSGRILLTVYLAERLPDRILLSISAAIGSTFYLLTIVNRDYRVSLVLLFLAGLGMSGDMVSLTSFTAARFRTAAAKAFSITQALGQGGAALGPYIIGFVGTRQNTLEHSIWLIPSTIAAIAATAFSWEITEKRILQVGEVRPGAE